MALFRPITVPIHRPRGDLDKTGTLWVPGSVRESTEEDVVRFCSEAVPSGGTFVDVGAHSGFYAIPLAPLFHRVIALEPSRMQRRLLRFNKIINRSFNLRVVSAAGGSESGHARIYVNGRSGGSNSLVKSAELVPMRSYGVRVRPLDFFGFKDVKLLKIDVEGWELQVLRGAQEILEEWKPRILVESNIDSVNADEVVRFLASRGYHVARPFSGAPELILAVPQ